jgi:hypothetical protein
VTRAHDLCEGSKTGTAQIVPENSILIRKKRSAVSSKTRPTLAIRQPRGTCLISPKQNFERRWRTAGWKASCKVPRARFEEPSWLPGAPSIADPPLLPGAILHINQSMGTTCPGGAHFQFLRDRFVRLGDAEAETGTHPGSEGGFSPSFRRGPRTPSPDASLFSLGIRGDSYLLPVCSTPAILGIFERRVRD